MAFSLDHWRACHGAHCGEGPVLAILAMLARGAARGCGWLRSSHPLRCAPRPGVSRSGRESRLADRTGKLDFRRLPTRDAASRSGLRVTAANRRPVAGLPAPAPGVAFARGLVDGMAGAQQAGILAGMALRRGDIADAAVAVFVVVPLHEAAPPRPGPPPDRQIPWPGIRAGTWRCGTAPRRKHCRR